MRTTWTQVQQVNVVGNVAEDDPTIKAKSSPELWQLISIPSYPMSSRVDITYPLQSWVNFNQKAMANPFVQSPSDVIHRSLYGPNVAYSSDVPSKHRAPDPTWITKFICHTLRQTRLTKTFVFSQWITKDLTPRETDVTVHSTVKWQDISLKRHENGTNVKSTFASVWSILAVPTIVVPGSISKTQ